MSGLVTMLERLGLSQYLQPFVDEGFDTWETLMDITESDLEAINVKLGHRRKLQRAIIEARGKTRDNMIIGAPHPLGPKEEIYRSEEDGGTFSRDHKKRVSNNNVNPTGQKRKYRRHPKADETAPERPPSAYVIFSNQMRDKLKGQDLSFTEIAKIVGERWQVLASHEKEPCERQAQKLKERYYVDLIEYKKTPQYAQYQEYLAEFKAKHNQQTDNKKSKPESDEPDIRQNGGGESSSRVQFSPSSPSNTYDPSGNDWRRSESPASRKSPTYGSARNPERSPITPPVPNFRRFPVAPAFEEGNAHEEDSRRQAPPLPLLKHSSDSRSTSSRDLNSPHVAPYNRLNTNEPRRSPPRRGTLSNDDVPGLLRDDTKSAVSSDRSYATSPWMNQPYSLPAMEVMHGNKSRVLPVPLSRTNTNNGTINDRASGLSPPAHYSVLNGNHLSDRRDFRSKSSIATLLEAGEQIDRVAEKKIGPTADFRKRDRLWERE